MTTHALINLNDSTPSRLTPRGTHSGMDITLQNVNDSGFIYIGGAEVSSTSYGYRLMPNHAFSIELPGQDDLWAIGETSGLKLAVIKTNLESQN